VVSWRPPPGAPATAWTEQLPTGQLLHGHFEVADPLPSPGALLARLDAQAMIPALRVVRHGKAPTHWRLRALPQYDVRGQFAGYVGTIVPVDAEEQRRLDQSVLQRLWGELDMPVVILRPRGADASGPDWEVQALSPDAARLLGAKSQQKDWQLVQQALPGDVQASCASCPRAKAGWPATGRSTCCP
jgi:hypothetical protein